MQPAGHRCKHLQARHSQRPAALGACHISAAVHRWKAPKPAHCHEWGWPIGKGGQRPSRRRRGPVTAGPYFFASEAITISGAYIWSQPTDMSLPENPASFWACQPEWRAPYLLPSSSYYGTCNTCINTLIVQEVSLLTR